MSTFKHIVKPGLTPCRTSELCAPSCMYTQGRRRKGAGPQSCLCASDVLRACSLCVPRRQHVPTSLHVSGRQEERRTRSAFLFVVCFVHTTISLSSGAELCTCLSPPHSIPFSHHSFLSPEGKPSKVLQPAPTRIIKVLQLPLSKLQNIMLSLSLIMRSLCWGTGSGCRKAGGQSV